MLGVAEDGVQELRAKFGVGPPGGIAIAEEATEAAEEFVFGGDVCDRAKAKGSLRCAHAIARGVCGLEIIAIGRAAKGVDQLEPDTCGGIGVEGLENVLGDLANNGLEGLAVAGNGTLKVDGMKGIGVEATLLGEARPDMGDGGLVDVVAIGENVNVGVPRAFFCVPGDFTVPEKTVDVVFPERRSTKAMKCFEDGRHGDRQGALRGVPDGED